MTHTTDSLKVVASDINTGHGLYCKDAFGRMFEQHISVSPRSPTDYNESGIESQPEASK